MKINRMCVVIVLLVSSSVDAMRGLRIVSQRVQQHAALPGYQVRRYKDSGCPKPPVVRKEIWDRWHEEVGGHLPKQGRYGFYHLDELSDEEWKHWEAKQIEYFKEKDERERAHPREALKRVEQQLEEHRKLLELLISIRHNSNQDA